MMTRTSRHTAPSAGRRYSIRPQLALAGLAALMLQGCAGTVSPQQRAGYETALSQGNYAAASQAALAAGGIKDDGTSDNLFWSLNAGSSLFYDGRGARAVPVLDNAETLIGKRDVGQMSQSGQYRATTYDGVMANTYKALAFVAAGKLDEARVEFNRVDDRQRRAEDEFEAEAAKSQQKLATDAKKAEGINLSSMMQSAEADAGWQQEQALVASYAKYQPFINPLSSYLYGVFFLATAQGQPDYEKARASFQRVKGLIGQSPLLDAELGRTQAWASGGKHAPKIWVVVEDGQNATIGEYRLVLPVPIVLGQVKTVKTMVIAMPRLQFAPPSYPAVVVGDATRTVPIGSFDAVVASEFKRRAPSVMAAAVGEAAVKIVMENLAAKSNNALVALVADVAAHVSTVDRRSWVGLPKDFQAACVDLPADGNLRLRTEDGHDLGPIKLAQDRSSLVYVKLLSGTAAPSIQVLPL